MDIEKENFSAACKRASRTKIKNFNQFDLMNAAVVKLVFPAKIRHLAERLFNAANISYQSIYPDEIGIAKSIKYWWLMTKISIRFFNARKVRTVCLRITATVDIWKTGKWVFVDIQSFTAEGLVLLLIFLLNFPADGSFSIGCNILIIIVLQNDFRFLILIGFAWWSKTESLLAAKV